MNARTLQQAVVDDLEKLFSDKVYKTPNNEMKPLRCYAQELPKFNAQDDDDFFPYIIVRLDNGGVQNMQSPHTVNLLLVIGVFDDGIDEYRPKSNSNYVGENGWDNRNFGNFTVLEIIEKTQKHYENNPVLNGGEFQFTGEFYWAMQDEQSYPYYFGACQLAFELPAPRKVMSKFV